MSAFHHQPVLLDDVLRYLAPRDGAQYVDATVGGGGHAEAILEASAPGGELFGVDRDPDAVEAARARLARFGPRARVVHGRYSRLGALIESAEFGRRHGGRRRVDGILVDAGTSSHQLDTAARGFSFATDGPLDMRMSREGQTAASLLDAVEADELARILAEYGEVEKPRRLARAILEARRSGRLESTRQLADLVAGLTRGHREQRIHPATQVFQALRIAVNEELDDLAALCRELPDLLEDGGVAVLIAFHSLEDRIVKRALRDHAMGPHVPRGVPIAGRPKGTLELLTARPVGPSAEEAARNPRARSARLRAARRLARGED